MSVSKILFPTDFSESSQMALRHATSLAIERCARLLIVHVLETPVAVPAGAYTAVVDPDLDRHQDKLREIIPKNPRVEFEHRLVRGKAADGIVRLAEDENVELIVMATHGRTGLKHLLMGSVAESVVRRAICPVLTLRNPEKERVPT